MQKEDRWRVAAEPRPLIPKFLCSRVSCFMFFESYVLKDGV